MKRRTEYHLKGWDGEKTFQRKRKDSECKIDYSVLMYSYMCYGESEDPEYRTKESEEYLHKKAENFGYEDCLRYAKHIWKDEFDSEPETKVEIVVMEEVTQKNDEGYLDYALTRSVCIVSAVYDPKFPDYDDIDMEENE